MTKRIVLAALALLVAFGMVACGSEGESSESLLEDPAASESPGAGDSGVTYGSMEMGLNETAAREHVASAIEQHVRIGEENEYIEGVDYLDVRGVEPVFVGYEVVAWVPIEGSDEVDRVDVDYVGGKIVGLLSDPGFDPDSIELYAEPYHVLNIRPAPENPSDGEADALAAAKEYISGQLPDEDWEYGILYYLFLLEKDGKGVVLGVTLDGDLLGRESGVVELAQ